MKRKLFAGALIALCLTILAYGTVAYFTDEKVAHNVITSGEIDIKLLEWADEAKTTPFPEAGLTGVMPSTSATKIVEIKNTGSNAAYVRARVLFSIDGGVPADQTPLEALVTLDLPAGGDADAKWEYNQEDRYYYYKEALEPGETTAPLFTNVGFDKTMGNWYQNKTIHVEVKAQATQAANNGTSVLDAKGWPEASEEL